MEYPFIVWSDFCTTKIQSPYFIKKLRVLAVHFIF